MSAANIYEESRLLTKIINNVPSKYYSREVGLIDYLSSNHNWKLIKAEFLCILIQRKLTVIFFQVEFLQKYAESEEITASSFGIIHVTRTSFFKVSDEREIFAFFDWLNSH